MKHRPNGACFLAALAALALGLTCLQGLGDLWAASNHHDLPALPQRTTFRSKNAFSVILLGTGCPRFSFKRAGPSTMIQYKGQFFLVDMGNQPQARLARLGVNPGDIETMMLTHHHIDHNEEYIPLSISSWLYGRKHLDLIGPPRTRALHEFLTTFYREDMTYRRAPNPDNWDGMISNVDIRELNGGESFVLHGVKITAAESPRWPRRRTSGSSY